VWHFSFVYTSWIFVTSLKWWYQGSSMLVYYFISSHTLKQTSVIKFCDNDATSICWLDMEWLLIIYFSNISQPTSLKCLCYVYYRTECIPAVKFHANYSRCQSFSNVHCWHNSIYFSLILDRTATVSLETYMSSVPWCIVF
jgi:hypothetical protein